LNEKGKVAVPRFYFDVRAGERLLPDEEGVEFESLDAAEREAAEATAEIGPDRLLKDDAREVTVEVRNEHRQRVLTVTVAIEVRRVDPEPQPPRVRQLSANYA
jgi:hypothetical protein